MPFLLDKGRAASEDPLRHIYKAYRKFRNAFAKAFYPFESAGIDVQIHYSANVDRSNAHRIKLGNYVRLRNDVRLQVLVPKGEKGGPVIVMGDATDIGSQSSICARNSIELENDVTLAQSVLIIDHNPAHEDIEVPIRDQGVTEGGRIRIEKGCFIGQGSAVLCDKGELVLGRNCVVAANSFVTRSFPSHCLIAGNPARVVQQFDPVKKEWVLGGVRKSEDKIAV